MPHWILTSGFGLRCVRSRCGAGFCHSPLDFEKATLGSSVIELSDLELSEDVITLMYVIDEKSVLHIGMGAMREM